MSGGEPVIKPFGREVTRTPAWATDERGDAMRLKRKLANM